MEFVITARMNWPQLTLALCILATGSLQGCRNIGFDQGPESRASSPETHYAPSENLEAIDQRLLDSAHQSIDLCAFAFTDHQLAEALVRAGARGVKIRIYLDRGQSLGELTRERTRSQRRDEEQIENGIGIADQGALERLEGKPNIEILVKHSKTLMHLKSYVIDRAVLRSGSANFSPTGEKRQDNDLILTQDVIAIERFERNFEVLWQRQDNEEISAKSD